MTALVISRETLTSSIDGTGVESGYIVQLGAKRAI
jgi:hypothetical protein